MSASDKEMIQELCEQTETKWDPQGYWTYASCRKCDNGCMGYIGPQISNCDNPPVMVRVDNPSPESCEDILDLARKLRLTVEISRDKIRVIKKGILEIIPDEVIAEETRYTPLHYGLLRVVYAASKEIDKWGNKLPST